MNQHRRMKDSGVEWIGEIPEGWTSRYLFQISSQVKCKNIGLKERNLLSLSYGNIKRKSIDTLEGLLPENFEGYNVINPNDIVLRLTDLQNDHRSLRVGISTQQGIITSAYLSIRLTSPDYPKYVYYYLHTFDICKGFYGMGSGVRQSLTWEEIKRLVVYLPSFEEQQKIISYLDEKCAKLDAVIEKQRASIEELKAYKLAVITEAVTKGLNPDVEMKESGVEWIGEMPKHWTISMLKNGIDILPGYAFSSSDFDVSNGIPLLRGINVTPSGIRWEEVVYYNQELSDELKMYELSEGDIVMGMDRPWISDGTRVCWVTKNDLPMLLVQRVCRIRARGNLDKRWIYYWLDSKAFQESLSVETTGVSVPHISTKQIGNFAVTLPPISEQKNICDDIDRKCSQIDSIIKGKENIVDNLIAYKKSLIYEVVTGKKEV